MSRTPADRRPARSSRTRPPGTPDTATGTGSAPATGAETATGPSGDLGRRRAKALGDPTRATIHRLLEHAATPLSIADLAEVVGVHRTAVGQHLAILVDAGLVERSVRPPAGRGRPVSVYRAVDDDPYRALAGWLAEALRTRRSAREIGQEIGRRHTDAMTATEPPVTGERRSDARATTVDPVAAIADEAGRLGFAPEIRRDGTAVDVVLHRCPFAELASVDAATVCQLHLGLAEGVVGATGGAEVTGLYVADPHRGGCRLHLRVTGPAPVGTGP